jgi:hypothetical protein
MTKYGLTLNFGVFRDTYRSNSRPTIQLSPGIFLFSTANEILVLQEIRMSHPSCILVSILGMGSISARFCYTARQQWRSYLR